MPTALVIGASRGIGREFAQQLLSDGWKTWATVRDDDSLAELLQAGFQAIKLDVSSVDSVAALAWPLEGVKIDLAVYVAGVFGPKEGAAVAPGTADFDRVMHTNVLGAMHIIPTIAPKVEAATGKFVFISSGMGSIAEAESSYGWVYRVSKAALNMAVKTAAFDYPKATFVIMCPGWVKTDMGGPNATITPEQSVEGMRRVIESLAPADSGTYRNWNGKHLSW
ncbi:MAG: SDR family oxidoreductase [Burkholderiales bacterium]|nr:SDR family oxidoreductase [Burkholderiales bacterium]